MRLVTRLFDRPAVYRNFHLVFSGEKYEYLTKYLEQRTFSAAVRVLDLGCGPGTSASLFLDPAKYDYLGVDMNPKYIEKARRAYPVRFLCADITTLRELGQQYDLIIINSVMHHLNDVEVSEVLSSARELLVADGDCVVLDMIQPAKPGLTNLIQRLMIRLDRGSFCRSLSQLETVLRRYFVLSETFSFSVDRFGVRLWDLRLFVCRRQ